MNLITGGEKTHPSLRRTKEVGGRPYFSDWRKERREKSLCLSLKVNSTGDQEEKRTAQIPTMIEISLHCLPLKGTQTRGGGSLVQKGRQTAGTADLWFIVSHLSLGGF